MNNNDIMSEGLSGENQKVKNRSPLRELKGLRMLGYSSGSLGQLLPITFINSYIMVFFVYTVGLNAFLVSWGTAFGAITNAIGGPVFGYLIDKKKPGRFGKRRPFLLIGLPLLFISFLLIWTPPLAATLDSYDLHIAIYLWVFIIAFYANYILIRSAYLSMLPEQSQTKTNRIEVSSIQAIFGILINFLTILLPMALQSLLNKPKINGVFHTTENGQFLVHFVPILAFFIGIIAIILTIIIFFSVKEDFHKINKDLNDEIIPISEKGEINKKKDSIGELLRGILNPFKDKNFRKYLLSNFSSNIGIRMLVKVLTPLFTYVLVLQSGQFIYYTVLLFPFSGLGFIFWIRKVKKWGLKKSYIISTLLIGLSLTSGIIIPFLPSISRIIVSFCMMSVVLFSVIAGNILSNPIISNSTDETQRKLKEGDSVSGSYFGSNIFILNIANAIGDLILGGILSGGSISSPNSTNPLILCLILPIAGILYILAVFFFRKIKLD